MTDISKCSGNGCIKKDRCFRYLATESEYQTYILIDNDKVRDCSMFWEIADEKNLKTTQKIWNDFLD